MRRSGPDPLSASRTPPISPAVWQKVRSQSEAHGWDAGLPPQNGPLADYSSPFAALVADPRWCPQWCVSLPASQPLSAVRQLGAFTRPSQHL